MSIRATPMPGFEAAAIADAARRARHLNVKLAPLARRMAERLARPLTAFDQSISCVPVADLPEEGRCRWPIDGQFCGLPTDKRRHRYCTHHTAVSQGRIPH